jgi:signal recognition particle subunit SRP19
MKMYSRDQNRDLHVQGRVKVQLYDDVGAPVNADAGANRKCVHAHPHCAHIRAGKALYLYVAQTIPKLKTRQQQKGGASVGGGDSAPAQSATSKANKKRKGK